MVFIHRGSFDVSNKKLTHCQSQSKSYILSLHRNNKNDNIKKLNLERKHYKLKYNDDLWNAVRARLVLKPCSKDDWSPTFSKYHYMHAGINVSCKTYSIWGYFSFKRKGSLNNSKNDEDEADDVDEDEGCYDEQKLELVGFTAFITHFGASSKEHPFDFREHRTVILPSFEGIGFGSRIADCIGVVKLEAKDKKCITYTCSKCLGKRPSITCDDGQFFFYNMSDLFNI